MLNVSQAVPSLVKYMGSKTEIIHHVINALNTVHADHQPVCDLFSGSCTLAGYLRENNIDFYSNDIQSYSSAIAETYCGDYQWDQYPDINHWIDEINRCVNTWTDEFHNYYEQFRYNREFSLEEFNIIEEGQRDIFENTAFQHQIDTSVHDFIRSHHLFAKYYSGTYWSFEQCIWIDCCCYVISHNCNDPSLSSALLSCLMFAMAYNSQSTGHYAQFRKAASVKSMEDILIYRRKELASFFTRKYGELQNTLVDSRINCVTTGQDFLECLDHIPDQTLVYADPPYCFVHYSRFYHILETLVKYDYPAIEFEGRYRNDRHQSPFCIRSKVDEAFDSMFQKLREKNCSLVLSYSNGHSNMISLPQLIVKAFAIFNEIQEDALGDLLEVVAYNISQVIVDREGYDIPVIYLTELVGHDDFLYSITIQLLSHEHSRMGRTETKNISVHEALVIVSNH